MKKMQNLLIVILLCISILFLYLALKESQPMAEAEYTKDKIKKIATPETSVDNESLDHSKSEEPFDRRMDFTALTAVNEDIVGWISIPNTSIDYPILIGETDSEYLNKDVYGKASSLGCIFSYATTSKSLTDDRIFLLGHNTSSYQMFGELKRYYKDKAFRNANEIFYLYTKERTLKVEIISIFTCKKDDALLYTTAPLGTEEYKNILIELCNKNAYADLPKIDDMDEAANHQSVSLITCKGRSGTSNRLLITGLVIEENFSDP